MSLGSPCQLAVRDNQDWAAEVLDQAELFVPLACVGTLEAHPNWEVVKGPLLSVDHLFSSVLPVGHWDAVPQRTNAPDQRIVVPTLEVVAVRVSEILCPFH